MPLPPRHKTPLLFGSRYSKVLEIVLLVNELRGLKIALPTIPTDMSYIDQMKAWLSAHPNATQDECFMAGYFQATYNWVNKETFSTFKKEKDNV